MICEVRKMAGKAKHVSRSRKTAKKRLMAARYYLNYRMTRSEREALKMMAKDMRW